MIIYGKQIFYYTLKYHSEKIEKIYLAKDLPKSEFSRILALNVPIIRPDFKKAQALARGGNHQGFLLELKPFEFSSFELLKNSNFLVLLYRLSDVGNIGAIIRTAYALGVDGILVEDQSLAMPALIRSSSAAALDLPIAKVQSQTAINELKQIGFKIHASGSKGRDIRAFSPSKKQLLLMGAEGTGLPEKIINRCDDVLCVSLAHGFDSLNVSSAFAILCDRMRNERL